MNKYLPGICFACQKCLFCFNFSPCNCNKNIKPTRVSKPERGQQIYFRVYTPNENLPTANYFLSSAETKFQYNNNFNEPFSFTFCSTCNSKYQRLKTKDKISKKKMKSKAAVDVESLELFEECGIDEIKLHVSIEKKGKKTSTSKALIIKPVEYINVMEKINAFVQKALQNENIKPADYSISYKAMNSRGLSSELEDELDFKEFIEDYKKVTTANKKMGMMVVIDNSTDNETKSSEKRSKNSDDVESDGSVSEEEKMNKGTTEDVPPTYPTFSATLGVLVSNNNTQISTTAPATASTTTSATAVPAAASAVPPANTPTPIIIQMPPFQYPYPSFNQLDTSTNHKLPSIHEFLFSLDQKYNCNGEYSQFENAFLEEAITVNVIKDLSDEQMKTLGIVKIGWQKNIRQEAQKY
ncbi:hypothetical protein GLOIN_2v1792901 [Rhizophagus irregularis DAOM 181602=DAOM 197198]|uniref:SAM domain-containing protein n=1 Tax=Rhizophagus irregularis (strain DAOM 181602 / DAOM 197198 / MUCL 43194) TaxID=747089 RepID=A0A2P4QVE2_RHIID|nr:hypothetical protein GLOIN_2v1792901 [Rhizophagus irregularis DAOM 181602=DAOM 197198]POG81616.1 hypothetical protein GLOIN_2v1792901 [Rhizophagus irregularis DAOM 181602=DAOM 197198]|eukprot:XP_025188482.1 hypothetical protein GLOIN_2v1792901 [Rhizophagus irregularis DAOM 181602=DAOM 197198]